MAFQLQSLLDLQKDAESAAKTALELAVAARAAEQAEQARFIDHWRLASAAAEEHKVRWASNPESAAQAQTRERFRGRLVDEVARAARLAEEHRAGVLAKAQAAEDEARGAWHKARAALDATLRLKQRADEEERKLAERRAENEAGDHVNAAFVRRMKE